MLLPAQLQFRMHLKSRLSPYVDIIHIQSITDTRTLTLLCSPTTYTPALVVSCYMGCMFSAVSWFCFLLKLQKCSVTCQLIPVDLFARARPMLLANMESWILSGINKKKLFFKGGQQNYALFGIYSELLRLFFGV